MSAYIVNEKTINSIVSYAIDKGLSVNDPQSLATMLMNENVRSVNYRYNETSKQAIKFEYVKGVSINMFFGAIQNLNYQSCETENYEKTSAYTWMNNALLELGLSWESKIECDGWWGIPNDWTYEAEQEKQAKELAAKNALEIRKQNAVKINDGKEIARLIRKVLKSEYSKVKFSVTSAYNKVSVSWTDGPSKKDVETLLSKFESGRFDGMTDLSYSEYGFFTVDNVEYFGGVQYLNTNRKVTTEFAQRIFNALDTYEKQNTELVTDKYGWTFRSSDYANCRKLYKIVSETSETASTEQIKAENTTGFYEKINNKTIWFASYDQFVQFKQLLAA